MGQVFDGRLDGWPIAWFPLARRNGSVLAQFRTGSIQRRSATVDIRLRCTRGLPLTKTMRLNYLFDFYQSLLTPKQQEYMNMYYLEDLSLVEISELANVSRQAIYDNIKRTEAILESYEEKLLLYDKFKKRSLLLNKLEAIVHEQYNSDEIKEMIHQLSEIS